MLRFDLVNYVVRFVETPGVSLSFDDVFVKAMMEALKVFDKGGDDNEKSPVFS